MLRKTPSCRLLFTLKNTSGVGLALSMSPLSSYLRRPIQPNCMLLGEVDLGRGIRPIEVRLPNELNAELAAGDGMGGDWKIYCHPQTAVALPTDITPIACEKLETVMYGVWPELR